MMINENWMIQDLIQSIETMTPDDITSAIRVAYFRGLSHCGDKERILSEELNRFEGRKKRMKIAIKSDDPNFMSGMLPEKIEVGKKGCTWVVGDEFLTVKLVDIEPELPGVEKIESLNGPIVLDPDPDISPKDESPFSLCGPPGVIWISGKKYTADLNQEVGPNYYRYVRGDG